METLQKKRLHNVAPLFAALNHKQSAGKAGKCTTLCNLLITFKNQLIFLRFSGSDSHRPAFGQTFICERREQSFEKLSKMANLLKKPDTEYVLKKGGNEVPIEACKGWQDSCEYCDKRFGEWISVPDTEDIYEKIPEKPGFFMIALKNKNITEVVSILFSEKNIHKAAITKMNEVMEEKSNKKSKATKSIVLVRWMVIKKLEDKENRILCAHWINNGVLPKFMTAWLGLNLLEDSKAVVFSKQLEKWCYPQKNPTWRTPKSPPSKTIEEIEKCNFESCEICDSYFSKWQDISDVIEKNLAPEQNGIIMLSAAYGKHREVVLIPSRKNDILSIRSTIKNYHHSKWLISDKKFEGKNARLEVRWMVMQNASCENSCLMYAHWLNADKWPIHNGPQMPLPGEEILNSNKHFVYRINDKKWFYETEALKKTKFSKAKNKRRVYDELNDELYYEDELKS